ncbi:MAG: hypothetical protein OEY49_12380, partial [Candidatus Heimdallarchaeota archaeon]|nr:hypothetical protein [Candidatus Heimdallarchaeota archaeon]
MKSSLLQHESILIDNILIHGYSIEEFVGGLSDPYYQSKYSVFNVNINKNKELSARYLSVSVAPLLEYVNIELYIGSNYIGTKVATYNTLNSQQELVFYIDEDIDTTRIQNVYIKTDGIVRLYFIGYLEENNPDEVLVAHSGTGNAFNNAFQRIAFNEIKNGNQRIDSTSTNQYFVDNNFASTIELDGSITMTSTGKSLFTNGVVDPTATSYQFGIRDGAIDGFCTPAELGGYYNFSLFPNYQLDPLRCYQNFDTAYERPDASIIGIHTNNIPHWIIIQFNVRVGGIGGSSTVTMPFYLFVNVNGATGGPPVSYGIRNLSYLQSGSINKLGDLMDLNLAGVSDNYAWSTVNINSRGYVLIDLNNEINRFVGKMDALVDTKKIQFTGVLSNLLQNLRFWAPNQIPIATETPTVYEGADPMDFITGNIIGSSDGYDLTFDGFSGAGFYTSSSDPLIVYDFFFIKDPNYTKFVAAENRYSSYFGGVNGGNQWTKLLTSDTGDVDLALPTFTDPNKINSALITFTINSNTGSLARFRLKSNMPSLIYINEVLVATTTDITDNFHPYSVVGNTYLKGGSNTVRIIALHPSDRFSETNVVYTNVGSQANEWVVGFKLLADHGLSYDMVSGDQPGFTDDFISQWTSSTTLLNLFGKRYDEYMVNTEKNDLGIFHDSILLPGETFSLKSDPNFSSRMTSGITSEEATIQLLRASDLASAFYINNDVTDPEGKFIATSTFHSTIDYKPMVFRIFMKDFDNLYALIIDKYQLSKIDTYDPTLNQFIVVDRQTGTEVSSISSTITMSPFDEEYTVLQFEMPIIAGIHRISLATQLLSGQNITNFVDDGALDIGIQLQSKVGGNPSFLSDDIYTFLKPHEYDPMNFKENFRQYVGLSQDEEGGGGMSFTSLSKKHEGTRSLSSSWFMARDGTPHLKRETFVGFESDAGPCEALAPNSNLAQSGMIYTKITIDPGTAQQASAVYQSYVDYTANSQSGVSNLYNQLSYNSLDKYTVQLSQRTSNYRNDVISLSDYGFQLQILIDGYHLVFNNQTIIQSLDYRGKPVDLGYSTNDMVRNYTEFYSSYTNTSQLDAINSISTFSIPYDYGITYTNYLDAISGSFPYMYQDTEASFIIFDSGDVSGVLLPAKSFLKFETSDGLEFEINLLSGTVRTHQKHSFNSRVYKPYEGKTFIVDFYDIYGISESTILPTSIINIFQELTNSHWKPGIASGPATAFSFAKAQAFQDPNFFNMVNQLNTPPPVDDDDQIDAVAEAVSKGIQKASKYIKGALDYAKKVVETAAEDPSKAVDMIVEDVNGLYTEISDAIGDVSEWFINSVSVYYQYQCAIAYNLLAFGIKIVAKMYNAIKAMFNEYITEPLKKVFNDVSDFIAEIFYNFEQDTINDADDAEITASSEPTKPSYVKNRKDIQSANSLLDIALRWQLGSQIEIIAGYLDLLFNARRDMLFLTFWGAVFGSAVGFTYTMADLFPDWEEDQTTSSESYKKHIAIPTKFIGADVLMMDAPVKHLKGSDSMVKLKANIMEIIIKTFGFSLTYDITPIGSQPLNSTKNFQNYDVIARPNLDNSTWHYFFALKSDFRFPLTLRQLLPLIGINERFLSVLIDGARNLIFTSLSNWLGEGVINDYNNGYTVQQIRTRNPNHPMAAVLIPLLGDITTLLTRLDIGLVFTLGTENWGLVGLDAIDSFKMNAPAVGPGSGDDADSYKTDEFGTQTDEKKWSFNVGISDKTWIFIVELLMNFIPGYGDLIGVLQSFRDLIMGDTFLDKAISFVMLPMDLRSFGGEKVATEIARKGATETAKKGLEAGSKGVIKGFLGRLDNVVGKVGEKVFYAGGGSGMKNAFKTLFWPVIVLKRKLFGSSVPKSLFAVIEKSVGKHTDKLMKKVRNTVSESAGDAFEVVTKDNMDQLAKEFASETADVAKRLTGELEVIKKKLIDDIDLDFKDSGIQTKLSGGFDSLEKDAKIKEIDLWIKNPEFIKDMAAQEAGLKVFKGDWDKLMNPPKKPKPPSESAILFKLATSKLGSNLIEFFSYFGKFIGSLLKTIKEIAESIAGFGYLFKSGLDDVPLNKFNFIDIFKESDSDRYIDDLVASGKLTKAEAVDLRSEVHDILKSKGEFNANVCTRPAGTIDDNIELTCEISQKAKDQKINQYTTNLIKKAQENIRMKKVMQEVNEEGNPKELGFYLSNDELKQFDIRDIDTWPDSLNNAQDITVITGGKPFAEVGEKEIAEIRVVIFSRITDDLMVDVRKYFSEDMIGKSGIEDHLVKIKSSYLATRGKKIEIPDSSGLIAEIDGAIRSIEATIPYIKSLPNLQAGLTDEALLNLIKQSTSILKSSDNSFDLAIFLQKKDLLDNVGESVGNEYLIFIGEAKGRSKLLDQLDKKISMIK